MAKLSPQQRIALAYETEQKYGLPKGMLVAQLHQESSDGTNTYNPEGPVGSMQIQPATAKKLGIDPNDDAQAIDGAARLMAQNLKATNGNPSKALELYYAGSPSGIGPRSRAYPGQVASKWNDDDAFDAASNFSAPSPDAGNEDDHFEKAATLTPDSAPAPQSKSQEDAPEEDSALANLKQGIELVAKQSNYNPHIVRAYITNSGYDPDSLKNLDANLAAHTIRWGDNFNPTPIQHTSVSDFVAGARRGVDDVLGSIDQFAAYEDKQHPFLGKIDNALSNIFPAISPERLQNTADANILLRKAYDQNYGTLASGTGRFAGQVAATAPVLGPLSRLATVAAEATGTAPAVNFALGKGGTNLLTRGLSLSSGGAIAGGLLNALTASASDEPLGVRMTEGAEGGAVLGPLVGAAGGIARTVASKVAPGVDAATAKLAKLAEEKYGIRLDGSQITNSPLVRRMDAQQAMSPFSGTVERDALQRGQFTRAVGQTFGADSHVLTPQVMQEAKDRLGQKFNDIAARNPVHVDDQLMSDLSGIESEAQQVLPDGEYAPIGKQLDNVISQAAKNNGTLTGEQYQALTRKGSPLDVASNSANPNIRHYAIQVRGALDDALERSANPEDLKALQQARLQYKNMKTVEPLASKSPDGTIGPALLNNRVSVNFKNRAYQGAGDLDELAQIGQRFLKAPASSGTAENAKAQNMLDTLSTAGGVGTAFGLHALGVPLAGDLVGGALVAGRGVASAGKNAILRRLFASDAYRNQLLGKALNTNVPSAVNLVPVGGYVRGVGPNLLLQQLSQPSPAQPQ